MEETPPDTGSLARSVAEAYVAAINAVDLDGLIALFAEDGVLDHAHGRYEGHAELRAYYAEDVLAFAPQVVARDLVEQGRSVTFSLEAQVDGASSHTLDLLTVNAVGLIGHLSIGFR